MLTGDEKFACCHPDAVSPENAIFASFVPVLDHRVPTWAPVLSGPL